MKWTILIISAYLAGSIPFGLIIARLHGKNLRSIGSGNIGATNLARAIGKKWAYLCFLLDALKGFVPMFIASRYISDHPTAQMLFLCLAVGASAVCGHVFPIYLKFKGGKGVATSFGITLGLWPYYTFSSLIALLIWIVVVAVTRYVSLASITATICFPLIFLGIAFLKSSWQLEFLWPLAVTATVMALLVVYRHKSNIRRLMDGNEQKIGGKATSS